jgi:predicted NAD/FAD-binding protein
MRIAIIGSGISGLTIAHYLNQKHDFVLFEKEAWIGGHAHTQRVDDMNIDTGFIVFNDKNYPNFKKLLDSLGVEYQKTEMSFSSSNKFLNLEYKGSNLNGLFANRLNFFNFKFYKFIIDIINFNRLAKSRKYFINETVGQFISRYKFGEYFVQGYLLPMGSAIWSMGISDMYDFPIDFLVTFFNNHGLLDFKNRPQWYTIRGGSIQYVNKLKAAFADKIKINTEVLSVIRNNNNILLKYRDINGQLCEEYYDKVVFANHAPEVLKILGMTVTPVEHDILSNILTSKNEVVLHHDISLLPKHKNAYASWNYLYDNNSAIQATVTYNMNILQNINCSSMEDSSKIYCVTLNNSQIIDPNKILAKYVYYHPIYSVSSMMARNRWQEISGFNHTYFCGAYWYNGFHEDGVVSALKVCNQLGILI